MGDFNCILNLYDKLGGKQFSASASTCVFLEFVKHCNLTDLYFGSKYTWCNNRHGYARISVRLDRVFGNALWFDSYENSSVYYQLPCLCSKHAPLKIKLLNHTFSRSKFFRFQNFWTHYTETNNLVLFLTIMNLVLNPFLLSILTCVKLMQFFLIRT